jgi:hypothetical protein
MTAPVTYPWGHKEIAMGTTEWVMPRPNIGDTVVFSKDSKAFTDPMAGWVVKEPGGSTISILTFTASGYAMVYHGCHHRDDPALKGDNGWSDSGAWEFSSLALAIRDLTTEPTSVRKPAK